MSETDSSPDVVSSDDDGSSDSVEIIVDNTDGPHPDAAESAGADSCDSDSSDDDEGSDGNGVDVVTKSVNVSNIDPLQANNGLRIAAGKVSQTLDFRKFPFPYSLFDNDERRLESLVHNERKRICANMFLRLMRHLTFRRFCDTKIPNSKNSDDYLGSGTRIPQIDVPYRKRIHRAK